MLTEDPCQADEHNVRICPRCRHPKTTVFDSGRDETGPLRRRRKCLKCDRRWTTEERFVTLRVHADLSAVRDALKAANAAVQDAQRLVAAMDAIGGALGPAGSPPARNADRNASSTMVNS